MISVIIGVTFLYILSFYSEDSTGTFDCAVVFGAAVLPGGRPSNALSDRTYEAIKLYENKRVSCLVFSGANSAYGKHEVDVMLDIAHKEGLNTKDIILDYNGINTKKTIDNLKRGKSYLFVSNDFHLARISLLARKEGIKKFAVQRSPYRFGRYSREPFFVAREIVAFWYYALGG